MKSIEVISIPVSDQEKSKEFYQKLGFKLLVEAPMGNGQTWVQLGIPGQITSISLVNWWPFKEAEMKAGSLHGIVLETEDIEKEVKDLKTKGIELGKMDPTGLEEEKIMDTPWGRFVHFKDPDGNGLNFHQNNPKQ